ncbi:MAG: site-specific integrase [Rhodospirillales bacterium]|jgi:integrase|nr:site-specific integrase [Rhodospirillales bacterium]
MKGKKRITKRVVDALKPGEIAWDTEVKGFGVRCQRRDRVYVLKTRVHGRQRWFSIGPHGSPWTVEKARGEARRILGEIADKRDPATFRDAEKANPTVADLAAMFLQEHVRTKRKASTAEFCRDILERIVVPKLGRLRVTDVTHSDVARLHHSLRGTPYQANRVLAVMSKMFNWAEPKGYRESGSNPCRHVEKNPEKGRERFLSEEELVRLADVLNEAEHEGNESPYITAAVRLLIFTGARRGEILNLEWSHVDFKQAMLLLPDSKTGKKTIYLSPPALEVLANIPRLESNPFVICGNKPGEHLVNLTKPWRRIRKRAGLEDVRIHDLRHSFASVAASGGLSLPMIGKLLGHTQAATTERYAHLAADPIRAANEAIGQRIAAAMKGAAEGGEVVKLEKRGA